MVDLPQHAGQIAIWLDWNEPDLRYQDVYRQAPLPPAFVSTAIAFALAHVVSVELALKIVVAIAVLAVPFILRLLVREVSGNPWWGFLGFPVGFGFPFGFGFINFCLGVPAALFLVLVTVRYTTRPSRALAAGLFGTTLVLFAIHAIAFVFGIVVAGWIILLRSPNVRTAFVRVVPLLLLLPFVIVWLMAAREADQMARMPAIFQYGFFRLILLPAYMTGPLSFPGSAVLALVMFVAPFMCGGRLSRQPWRWTLLVVSVALFLGAPNFIFGTGFIYQRFAVFCIPGLLLALDWVSHQEGSNDEAWVSLSAPALVLMVLIVVGLRFWQFNIESGGLTEVLAQIPRGARLLYLPVERGSAVSPFPVYLHSGMWHQVRRGGVTDFSFARFHMNRFRYRDGVAPNLPMGFEWTPQSFDWERHGGEQFDYFLVRSVEDSRMELFKGAVERIVLVDRRESWWLFRRLPAPQISQGDLEREASAARARPYSGREM
jgi:hypothetical protein